MTGRTAGLLLAVLAAGPARAAQAAPGPDLAAVSRAMAAAEAAAAPEDEARRFLALYARPRDEQGWEAFRALADRLPASPWPHLGMARVYLEWRTWDQLDAELARAEAKAPGNWIARLLRGEGEERRGRPAGARREYQAVLATDPGNAEARAGLARLAAAAGDVAGARSEAREALAALPGMHGPLALLGQMALAAGELPEARRLLAQAVEASPRDRESRIALARLLREVAELARRAGDAAGERRALERLVQVEPGPAAGWRRLAALRLAAADEPGASQALHKTLEREPGDGASRVALARLHAGRGDSTAALRELKAAGEAGAAERIALERRANVERVEGRDAQAIQRAVGRLVDRTYRERLRAVPRLSGELRLRVAVDAQGAATQVDVVEDTVHDDLVRACAYWNLRDASYPKNAAGRFSFGYALRPGTPRE